MQFFITGVSSGIGRELARALVRDGHEVRGVARRAQPLQALAAELGPAFTADVCDIGDLQANERLRETMRAAGYVPDVVVLNAALDKEDERPGLDTRQSAVTLRTNYDGAHYWIAAFIEAFLQRGSGEFIGVASIYARWPNPASVSYCASKSALAMLLRGLRLRYPGSGIRFKLLYLGPVDTPINPRFAEDAPATSRVVASAPATAAYIAGMVGRRRENFYYPFYIAVVFTFLRWLPDRAFQALTGPFRR